MKRHALLCAVGLLLLMPRANAQKSFTLEQVMSAPFPSSLTAAKNSNRVAWVLDQEGRRNIWAAEGPGFTARQITKYSEDDGQESSNLSFSADSNTIVYVRGEGKNAAGQVPNPTSNPAGTEQAVWTIGWSGGEPKRVDAGHSPQISPRGTIAYVKDGQICSWLFAGKTSTRIGLQMEAGWLSFPREPITPSSVFMTSRRRLCNS